MEYPHVALLVVTERRPMFAKWWREMAGRIRGHYPGKLSVVCVSDRDDPIGPVGTDVYSPLFPQALNGIGKVSLGERRNHAISQAVEHTDAQWFTWMDDDDWYAPDRITRAWEAADAQLGGIQRVIVPAGNAHGFSLVCMRAKPQNRPINWTEILFHRELAAVLRFFSVSISEDFFWVQTIKDKVKPGLIAEVGPFDPPSMLNIHHPFSVSTANASHDPKHWPIPLDELHWLTRTDLELLLELQREVLEALPKPA